MGVMLVRPFITVTNTGEEQYKRRKYLFGLIFGSFSPWSAIFIAVGLRQGGEHVMEQYSSPHSDGIKEKEEGTGDKIHLCRTYTP
jgi:hypothetical protein